MGGLNILGTFQVSYRSTHLEDPVVRPGAHAELGDGRFQEPLPLPAHLTEASELPCAHPITQTASDLATYIRN